MKRLVLSVLVVFAIAAAVVGCGSSNTSSGNTELQGTWVNSTTGLLLNTITFNFNSNQWNMMWAFGSESNTLQMNGTFNINPSANPKTIDMVYTSFPMDTATVGQTSLGIYELSGSDLTLDLGDPGNTSRPTAFGDDAMTFTKQ